MVKICNINFANARYDGILVMGVKVKQRRRSFKGAKMFLIILIITAIGLWLSWHIAWRLLVWTFQPLADYFDEKEKRQSARINELGRTIIESTGAGAAGFRSCRDTEDREVTDLQEKCPWCGVPLDTGAVESFLHGESPQLNCPLCDAEIIREDLLS